MTNYIDISGQKFHKLTAIEYRGNRRWLFRCECGNLKEIRAQHVKSGKITSCGCRANLGQIILQYTLDGKLVASHNGVAEAGRSVGKTNSAIGACCDGELACAYGYIWKRHTNGEIPKEITPNALSVKIPDLEGEEWRDVRGYEGKIAVSNLGRVKTLSQITHKADGRTTCRRERLKKPYHAYGYLMVGLPQGAKGVSHPYFLHRIIAEAFIPNPNNLPQIDHINTIRDDNRIENLRWVTPKENMNNPLTRLRCSDTGKRKYKDGTCLIANISRRRVRMLNKQGIALKEFNSIKDAAKEVGVSYTSISNVLRGWSKSCRGYLWEYA